MSNRPDIDHYMMDIAKAVRERANCLGRRVGAIVVRDRRIISTGYNGTPYEMANCEEDQGCLRCREKDQYPPGVGYDLCICVHAEQNAILAAARFGIATEGSTLYSTMKPCFSCLKEALQAKIVGIRFWQNWEDLDEEKRQQYEYLVKQFPEGVI